MPDKHLKSKLDRFSAHVKSGPASGAKSQLPGRYRRLARSIGGTLVERTEGIYCLIETNYRRDHALGTFSFDRVSADPVPLSAFTALEEPGHLDLSAMLFVDTETTGLGGAGAVPFLVGCGSFKSGGFEVRQYFLPDYSDEAAMLEDLLSEFTSEKILVTYNGAAFDLPLIRDRMIINRVASEVEFQHHLDLLHSTRRLFRRRLNNCTLTNVEASVFGFERADDIPGYLIPSVYFDWLSEENLDLMHQVLEHNRLDIVSLCALVHRIAEVHSSGGEVLDEIDDLHSLSRVFGRRRNPTLVKDVFEKIGDFDAGRLADDIILYHAMNFKRLGDIDKAVQMWQSLAQSGARESYWANLELAKYFEHCQKNLELAVEHTRRADEICPYGKTHRQQLSRRLSRLKAKLNSQ